MYEDEVIKEVHRVKEEIAAEYNYNVRKFMHAMREEQFKDAHKIADRCVQRYDKRSLEPSVCILK